MKYLKKFENIEIDPFEEEDWDEIDEELINKYLRRYRQMEIPIDDIPFNIIKSIGSDIFIFMNRRKDSIEKAVDIYQKLRNEDNENYLFDRFINNFINNKRDFNILVENKDKIENFKHLIEYYSINLISNIVDIDLEFFEKLKIEYDLFLDNEQIFDILRDKDFINNVQDGKILYRLSKFNNNFYLYNVDYIDSDILKDDEYMDFIGYLYSDNKVEKNSYTTYCAYRLDIISLNEYLEKIKLNNLNGEYYVKIHEMNDLKDFFDNNNYSIEFEEYHEFFHYDHEMDINGFTSFTNKKNDMFLIDLFKNNNIGDFSQFSSYEKDKTKIKQYIEHIIYNDINNEEKDFDIDELKDIISRSLLLTEEISHADYYFEILTNYLQDEIFNKWKDNNSIYKWNNKNELIMKPHLSFFIDLDTNIIDDYGMNFEINDILSYHSIYNKINPYKLEYINGNFNFNEEVFNEILHENLLELY